MTSQSRWRGHFEENKTLFIILAVGLFLVELEIFAMAAMKSGRESRLQIANHLNNVIYETGSSKMDAAEKAEFESTFGPLANYQAKLVTLQRPFPFRAWFAAAVGLPIGAMLLFGFFVKAYEALFFSTPHPPEPALVNGGAAGADKLDRIITRVSRLNIFAIGSFVLLFVIGLFAVPHLLSEFGRHGAAVITRYRWVVLGVIAVFLGLVTWIIFLRYLLARKTIETQADVEKYRLQLELLRNQQGARLIDGGGSEKRQLPGASTLSEPPAPRADNPR